MNTKFKVAILPFLILTFFSFNASKSSITIEQALKEKKIEIEILPTGTYSGNSINILVKNISNGPITIVMDPGTTFVPEDNGEQTLVTTQEQMLAIHKGESKNFMVFAYCTEASDRCPSTKSKFTISKSINPTLLKLANFIDSLKNQDDHLIQQSVWCVTDSESVSNIYSDDLKSSKALRNYICSITGQKDTWYSTRRDISVGNGNVILSVPKEVKGELAFESTEPVELQGFVKDSTGKIIVTNPHKTNLPAGKIKFEFNMKVNGWAAGNYTVVYTNNGQEVINQPFSF